MLYSKEGLIVSLFLLIFFVIGYFILRKYKVLPLFFPLNGASLVISILQKILIFLILFFSLVLPLNIGIYQGTEIKKVPVLNIQILFDVSLSMTAKDIKPDRFTATKQALVNFINSLGLNYNVGLIVFSGKPLVWIPFSSDKKALIWKISHMSMADFPPSLDFVGTAIGDALLLGTYELEKISNKKYKPGVILLLTDGDSNKGVNPLQVIKYLKALGIPVFVGAIGNERNYVVGKDIFGTNVPTNIDLNLLKKLAKDTSGEFMKIQQKEDLLKMLNNLKTYVKNSEKVETIAQYTYINYYILQILIFVLTIYVFLYIKFKL